MRGILGYTVYQANVKSSYHSGPCKDPADDGLMAYNLIPDPPVVVW